MSRIKNTISDFTEGNIVKQILAFYFPMFITNMLQQVYTFVDTLIVGRGLGDKALAAVGNINPLCFLIIGFSMGLSNGFCVLIAKHFGAKDYPRMRKALAASLELVVVICLTLSVLSVSLLPEILRIMKTDPIIIEQSLTYGRILFFGLSATVYYNLSAGILRALGDSRTPLRAIVVSSVTNIILDYVLIFIVKTGVEGAAWATVVSQLISGTICLRAILRIDILHLDISSFAGCSEYWVSLLSNGVPMAAMNSITAVGCMVVQTFVNEFGVLYTSTYTACIRYMNLFMNPAMTAGISMSSFASQNDGAENYERVHRGLRVCLGIAFSFYVLLGSATVIAPKFLAGLMLNEPAAIELAGRYLPITGIFLISVDCLFVYRSAVQGLGRPFMPMVSGIAEMVLRIGVISLFMRRFGFITTAWAEVSAWTGALLVNMIAYYVVINKKKKGYWK